MPPTRMPGDASGKVTLNSRSSRPGAERARRLLQTGIDRLQRQPHGAHHHRKRHHRAGEAGAGGGEHQPHTEPVVQQRADRSADAEQDQQQPAGDHRRQHQRQMHQRVQQRPARETVPRQNPGHRRPRAAGRSRPRAPRRPASAGRPPTPRAKGSAYSTLKPRLQEHRARLWACEESQQRARLRRVAGFRHRERIGNRIMTVGGEHAGDHHGL